MNNRSTSDYRHLLNRYAWRAPHYDRRWGRYSQATLSKALVAVPRTGEYSLLDVACGTGLFAEMLLRQRPDLRITGVDISPPMLEKARQRIAPLPGKIAWLTGHAEALPVESSQFDVLTCTNAFHLVQDARSALAEFRRALKPGGTLVLVDWCRDFPLMQLRDVVLKVADRQRRQIRRLSELVTAVAEGGFIVQSGERFRARTWGMMCVVARSGVRSQKSEVSGDIKDRSAASELFATNARSALS